MRAMVCPGLNQRLIADHVALPKCGPSQLRLRTLASGVCHSDLSFARGYMGGAVSYPILLGHEAVGEVIEVGSEASRFRVGDVVIASILPACGHCWFCDRRMSQHCSQARDLHGSASVTLSDGRRASVMAGLGSFAEEMLIGATSAVAVTSELPSEQLALIGCGVTTGVGAVLWTAGVEPGASVAVFGCGGVGQAVVMAARLAGAEKILAIDPVPFKRQMAGELGATETIDPAAVDPVEAVRSATGGRGADYAFEVIGRTEVMEQAVASVRKRGVAVMVGMPAAQATVTVPSRALFYEEKRVTGSLYGSAQIRSDLQMLVDFAERGRLPLERMISQRIPLEQLNEAFDALDRGTAIRSVIVF